MIYLTAITFLLVGYIMGIVQHQPTLPQDALKRLRDTVNPPRVGAVKRPSAEQLARKPQDQEEDEETTKLLNEIGVPKR